MCTETSESSQFKYEREILKVLLDDISERRYSEHILLDETAVDDAYKEDAYKYVIANVWASLYGCFH